MTNSEIYAKADRATEQIDLALGNEFEIAEYERVQKILLDLVSSTAREAQAEAYEESARAGCRYCRQGVAVVAVSGSVVDDLVPLGETVYLHRRDGLHLHGDMPCESRYIRALKDSLVAETVSS